MYFQNVLVILLSSLALGIAAHPIAPTSDISSQPLVQARSEAGLHEAMIFARASKKGKSSGTTNGNTTDTQTNSASGPVIVGGYAPLVLGMGMVAALGLNVL